MRERDSIRIGTSGWSYDHWAGNFYPDDVASAKRLPYYATHFTTVEINTTFYHLPTEHAVQTWHDEVPPGFAFSAKGSRFITHFRKLSDAKESVALFLAHLAPLAEKLEVVLWQLPPDLPANPELLDGFLGELPSGALRHAVEFRDRSWLAEETFAVLRKHNAAHVQVSSDQMPENLTVTADFVYIRMHGTLTYHGAYEMPQLEPWADFLHDQKLHGRGGYVYFNNDAAGHAPKDAARLIATLGADALKAAAL
jgi:uncharacterized protein YecE (DUF72 family)